MFGQAFADEALLTSSDDDPQEEVSEEFDRIEDPDDASSGPVAPGFEPSGDELASALDTYLSQNVASTGVPGIAVAIVDSQGVRYEATLGDCPTADSTFIIGSLSKSITAVAIMQLAEQGLIDLDAPVATYVSDLSLPNDVTIRALLNQTSGFGYYESLADAHVGDTLGTFSYANANYDLLGRVVESVSGQDYGSYVRDHIFYPLNMQNASAGEAQALTENVQVAPGHRSWFGIPVADGFSHRMGPDSWGSPASGYVRASLRDMEAYLRMYLNSGSGVLDATSVHQMVFSRVPDESGDTYYGMGWTTYTWGDGELIMSHDGQVENYVARMCIIPGRDLGIVVLGDANDEFGGNEAFFSLADNVVSIAVGAQPSSVDSSLHAEQHIQTNIEYCLVILACVALLVYAIRSQRCLWHVVPTLLIHGGIVLFLLMYPRFFAEMRWRDFADFYPDQTLVLLICIALLTASGAIKLVRAHHS